MTSYRTTNDVICAKNALWFWLTYIAHINSSIYYEETFHVNSSSNNAKYLKLMVGKLSLQEIATLAIIWEISDSNLETGRYSLKSGVSHFPHLFPDDLGEVTKYKIHVFIGRNHAIFTRLGLQQKDFEFSFISLSYSFRIEMTNTFIHSHYSSLPDSRTKRANSLAVFRPKQHKNHTFWGGSYLVYGLYNGISLGLL